MKFRSDNKAKNGSAKNISSRTFGEQRDPSLRLPEKLFNIALRAVSRRRLTEHQLRESLVKKISQHWYESVTKNVSHEFLKNEIDKVLGRMKHLGYINDADFAELFIRDTLLHRPHGSMWIKGQLMKKGIDTEVIARAMEVVRETGSSDINAHEDLEYNAAKTAAEKKLRTLEREEPKKRYEKMFRFLCSRGFAASMAFRVLDEIGLLRSGEMSDEIQL